MRVFINKFYIFTTMKRRQFNAKAIEGLAIIPMAVNSGLAFFQRNLFPIFDTENAQRSGEKPTVTKLHESQKGLETALDGLYSAYRGRYYESYVTICHGTNADGDPTTYSCTKHHWTEPSSIYDHGDVSNWEGKIRDLTKVSKSMIDTPLLDPMDMKNIDINLKAFSPVKSGLISTAVYSAIGALVLYYEELYAAIKYSNDYSAYGLTLDEKVHKMNSQTRINRRAIMKAAVAFGLGHYAAGVNRERHNREDEQHNNEMDAHKQTIRKEVDAAPQEFITSLYGTSASGIEDTVLDIKSKAKEMINHPDLDDGIKPVYANVIEKANAYIATHKSIFGQERLPRDLQASLMSTYLQNKINAINSDSATTAGGSVAKDALTVGAYVGIPIALGELALHLIGDGPDPNAQRDIATMSTR